MKFLRDNAFPLLVVILFVIIIFQRCSDDKNNPIETVTRTIDTAWIVKDSLVFVRPLLATHTRDTIREKTTEFMPSGDYEGLVKQFESLREELLSKNTYTDTLRIDTSGYIAVTDEVQRNMITERKYDYKLKFPEITKTITTTKPIYDGRQLYIGGGLAGNKDNLVNTASLGLLYKDKKDRIYGVGAQKMFSPNLPVTYGVSTYWKIKTKH